MEQRNQNGSKHKDVFELITDRVITQLEKGIIPWHRTWIGSGLPQNLITKRPYRGINLWLLSSLGYQRNYFLTFKQIKQIGGSVRRTERPTPIVFWKWTERDIPGTEEKRPIPILRYYMVYNVSQVLDIPIESIPAVIKPNNPIEECEKIVQQMPQCPKIILGDGEPFYHTLEDFINMPSMDRFISSEFFYGTLFHELIHSTGFYTRLNRREICDNAEFGSANYAIEELTGELGACYLRSLAGIETVTNESVSYINSWLNKLKSDKKLLVYAGSQAQRAVDFITSSPIVMIEEEGREVANGKEA